MPLCHHGFLFYIQGYWEWSCVQDSVHNHVYKLYVSTTVLFDVSNEYHSLVTARLSAVVWALCFIIVFSFPSLFPTFPKLIRWQNYNDHIMKLGLETYFREKRFAYKYHTRVKFAYVCYLHTHGTPFYAAATYGARRSCTACTPMYLTSAVLAMGSATCNANNLVFVTPVSAHAAHAIVVHTGVGIT